MKECKAPDCDNEATRVIDGYCSNLCMNVGVEVAALKAFEYHLGEEMPDWKIAEIRERNEKAHEEIRAKIDEHQE